jgi:hypothetical protein
MRAQESKAGIRLWAIAREYKEYRTDLTDKMAFRMALLSNPDLAESYLGHPVRRDGHAQVIRILYSPTPLSGTEI